MFRLIKQVLISLFNFSGSLASMTKVSNFTTYIFLIRPTLIDLKPDRYNQGLCYDAFMVKYRCNGSWNTFYNPCGRIYVPNKTENINVSVFNIMFLIFFNYHITIDNC